MIIYKKQKGSEKTWINEYYCDLCKQRKEPNELHSFKLVDGKLATVSPEERELFHHHLCIDCRHVVSNIFPSEGGK